MFEIIFFHRRPRVTLRDISINTLYVTFAKYKYFTFGPYNTYAFGGTYLTYCSVEIILYCEMLHNITWGNLL